MSATSITPLSIRGQRVQENFTMANVASNVCASQGTTSNSSAVAAAAADSSRPLIVSQVWWSYEGGSVAGNIQLTDGDSIPLNLDIASAGAEELAFSPPLIFATNAAVTLTLAAGGAGVAGKVGFNAYKLQ